MERADTMKRLYEAAVSEHFQENRQILFLMGPRQVGKTTTGRTVAASYARQAYYNWDNQSDRQRIVHGPGAIAQDLHLDHLLETAPFVLFDEIHKYGKWKTFLKGLFDSYPDRVHMLVTGSARLDYFKKGGDSLMGRYFSYRMHPLSLAELAEPRPSDARLCRSPAIVDHATFEALLEFGGFPEPFERQSTRFSNRWQRLRIEQLLREDLRDLTRIQEIGQLEVLGELLRHRVGQLVSYTSLAQDVNASVDSIRRWLNTLSALYYCFPVRPWWKNVPRSLRKEPRYYLWDWSRVPDRGARHENLVASALVKAAHFWTDHGLGAFDVYFLRDKQQREADFLVTRDQKPWFLVEVKSAGNASLSRNLEYFQSVTGALHAFQVAMDLEPVDRDCFEVTRPVIVPARTFLAQLV